MWLLWSCPEATAEGEKRADISKALVGEIKFDFGEDSGGQVKGQKREGEDGGGNRKKRLPRKGTITCAGCLVPQTPDAFAANQRVCMPCKRIMDRIASQAARQNQTQWYKDAKKTDKGLHDMISHYKKLMGKGDNKYTKFSVAEYKEVHSNTQGTEARSRGVMMWEQQAVEFWMTAAGGSLDRESAEEICCGQEDLPSAPATNL